MVLAAEDLAALAVRRQIIGVFSLGCDSASRGKAIAAKAKAHRRVAERAEKRGENDKGGVLGERRENSYLTTTLRRRHIRDMLRSKKGTWHAIHEALGQRTDR